ncbi:MAG TPA: hypothetical protein VMV97_05635 [Sulfuriferula sp.]|nr:hypothetical protein [Sulfuriferula sp.]
MSKSYFRRIEILSAIVFAGIIFMGFSSGARAWEPVLPKGVQGPVSWNQNGKDGRYFVAVVQGTITEPTTGVVKTDADCMPDSQGLNHCHNIIELKTGKVITIQNTHKMSEHRCLRPGEQVKLRPDGASSWAIVQTMSDS